MKTEKSDQGSIPQYGDWDVILTTENEFMYYWEAEKFHCLVERRANDEESDSYKLTRFTVWVTR